MQWGNPSVLWLCLAALPLFLLVLRGKKLRRRARQEFCGAGCDRPDPVLPRLLPILCFLSLALALAAPRFGAEPGETLLRSGDLVVVLDVSKSMLTEDAGGSRLAAAKKALAASLDNLRGERVGLVAFAGQAFVVCPLTTDYALFEQVLARVGEEAIPLSGTSLAAALDETRRAFAGSGGERMAVLLSDGEDHAGGFLEAARFLGQSGAKLVAVPVGSGKGGLVPVPGGGYLEKGGGAVLSRMELKPLKETAGAAGGRVVELRLLPEAVREWSKGVSGARKESRTRLKERFQLPLALALLLLFLEPLAGRGRKR